MGRKGAAKRREDAFGNGWRRVGREGGKEGGREGGRRRRKVRTAVHLKRHAWTETNLIKERR
jgi:hypothetical protein